MCGICGSSSDPRGEAVQRMNQAQRHRGPDDDGVYLDPERRMALGVRRLSVIDVPGGHQPLSNEDGTVWVTYNGEIYNYRRLREHLLARGHTFSTAADTEVLVHLYEEYGDDLVHALEGMYAFALWDERRGRLILARDRFGEKPLFVHRSAGRIDFASEAGSLCRGLVTAPELRAEAMDDLFVFGYVPGPGTLFSGIEQLPPGYVLSWDSDSGACHSRSYWSPAREHHSELESTGELVAETRRLLQESVARTLVADVPVGVFISGGVDSALIAALACAGATRPPRTYTVGYDVGTVSELDAARRVAEALGTDHHELVLTEADVARRVPSLLASLDQPLADQALVPLHAVAELARRDVKVVVGGEGADELFGGYPRYRWLARAAEIRRVAPAGSARALSRAVTAIAAGGSTARLADVLAPQGTRERHLDWVTARRRHAREAVYGPRLRSFAGDDGPLRSLSRVVEDGDDLTVESLMHLDQRHWLPDDVLTKADRAGMLTSLEIRTPYLGRDIAELANGIRASAHLARGGKALLRSVLGDYIATAGTRRRKMAFRTPAAEWLRGPLLAVAGQVVEGSALFADGWFEAAPVRELLRDHARGDDHTAVLWPILAASLWYDGLDERR